MSALKSAVYRSDIFNMTSRIPEIELWIAFVSACTQ